MILILVIVLLLMAAGAFPAWPHSKDWGYYPTTGVIVVIILVLLLWRFY